MFQLGSDSCWGLAADMANRQLNIYVLLSSGKQTLFWGSPVWAVKSFYLCACLHNFHNSLMLNACKFCLNHDLAQGLSGVKMHTHEVQRDKSNNLLFLHKGLWNRGGHPLVKMATCAANEGSEGCMLFANSGQTEQPQSRDLPLVPNLKVCALTLSG